MTFSLLDPLEAVRRLGARFRASREEETVLERALGRYLSAPVEIPPHRLAGRGRRATLNGYALPRGAGPGDYPLPAGGAAPAPGSLSPEAGGGGGLPLRVETGDLVPPDADRVVAIESTVLIAGPGQAGPRLRILPEGVPPPGHGLLEAEDRPLVAEAGTRVEPRLLALLQASGLSSVKTHPPREVGVLSVGGELTDVLLSSQAGSLDLNGLWLPPAIRALGHLTHPLGAVADDLAEGRAALLRARQKGLSYLVMTGGLGSGVSDRTVELLQRIGAKITFEGVLIRPGGRCLLADWAELKVLALGGAPLEAAAAFDLFARPALLAALGAPARVWDWSERRIPASALEEPLPEPRRSKTAPPDAEPPWRAVPIGHRAGRGGVAGLEAAEPLSPFIPWIPGQCGWVVVPPPAPPGPGEPSRGFHFVPSSLAGEWPSPQWRGASGAPLAP
jgi:molybdopterin molybdotransferase